MNRLRQTTRAKLDDAAIIRMYGVPPRAMQLFSTHNMDQPEFYVGPNARTADLTVEEKADLLTKMRRYVTHVIRMYTKFMCLKDGEFADSPHEALEILNSLHDEKYAAYLDQVTLLDNQQDGDNHRTAAVGNSGLYWITLFSNIYFTANSQFTAGALAWYNRILTSDTYIKNIFIRLFSADTIGMALATLDNEEAFVDLHIQPYRDFAALAILTTKIRLVTAEMMLHLLEILQQSILSGIDALRFKDITNISIDNIPQQRTHNPLIVNGRMIYKYGRVFDIMQKSVYGTAVTKVFTEYIEEALSGVMNYLCRVALKSSPGDSKLWLLSDALRWYMISCAISTPFFFSSFQESHGRPEDLINQVNSDNNPHLIPANSNHAVTNDELHNILLEYIPDDERLEQFVSLRSYLKDLISSFSFERDGTIEEVEKYYYFTEGLKRIIVNTDLTFDEFVLRDDEGEDPTTESLKHTKKSAAITWLVEMCKLLTARVEKSNRPSKESNLNRKRIPQEKWSNFVIGSQRLFWSLYFDANVIRVSSFIFTTSPEDTLGEHDDDDDAQEELHDRYGDMMNTLIESTKKSAMSSRLYQQYEGVDGNAFYIEEAAEIHKKNVISSTFHIIKQEDPDDDDDDDVIMGPQNRPFGAKMGRKVGPEDRAGAVGTIAEDSQDRHNFDEVTHSQLVDDLLFANRVLPIVNKLQKRTRTIKKVQKETFSLITLKKFVNEEVWDERDAVENGILAKRLKAGVIFNSYVDNLQLIPSFVTTAIKDNVNLEYTPKTISYNSHNPMLSGAISDHVLTLCMFSENVNPEHFEQFNKTVSAGYFTFLNALVDSGLHFVDVPRERRRDFAQEMDSRAEELESFKKEFFVSVIRSLAEQGKRIQLQGEKHPFLKLIREYPDDRIEHVRAIKKLRIKLHHVAMYDPKSPMSLVIELSSAINRRGQQNLGVGKMDLDNYVLSNAIEFEFNRDILIAQPIHRQTYLTAVIANSVMNNTIWNNNINWRSGVEHGDENIQEPSIFQIPSYFVNDVGLERPINTKTKNQRFMGYRELERLVKVVETLNINTYTIAEVMKKLKGTESPHYHLFNFLSVWSITLLNRYSKTKRMNYIRGQVQQAVGNGEGADIAVQIRGWFNEVKRSINDVLRMLEGKLKSYKVANMTMAYELMKVVFDSITLTTTGKRELKQSHNSNKLLSQGLASSYISRITRIPVPSTSTANMANAIPEFIIEELKRLPQTFDNGKSSLNLLVAAAILDIVPVQDMATKKLYRDLKFVGVNEPNEVTLDVFTDEFAGEIDSKYEEKLRAFLGITINEMMDYRGSIKKPYRGYYFGTVQMNAKFHSTKRNKEGDLFALKTNE